MNMNYIDLNEKKVDWLMMKPSLVLMLIDDGMIMNDVGKYLYIFTQYRYEILRKFERLGLVELSVNKKNKRSKIITLTKKGKEIKKSLKEIFRLKQDEVR